MLISRVAIFCGFALGLVLAVGSSAKSQQRHPQQMGVKQPTPKISQEKSHEEQQGTEQSPLIVKVVPPQKTDTERADETKERERMAEAERNKNKSDADIVRFTGELASFTRYLFYATVVLGIATIGLLVAAVCQSRDTKRGMKAAEDSANAANASVRAFIDSERGRVFVQDLKLIRRDAEDPVPRVDYTFVNAGRGTIVLIQCSVEFNLVTTGIPTIVTFDTTKVFGANTPVTPDSIIGSNTPSVFLPRCSVGHPLTAIEIAKIANNQAYLLFKGFIRYRTGFNDVYRRNFASVYGTHGDYFSEVTTPGYNEEYREPNQK